MRRPWLLNHRSFCAPKLGKVDTQPQMAKDCTDKAAVEDGVPSLTIFANH